MIGLFINTLPVRVQIERQVDIWHWLKQLQDQQSEARQYDYTPFVNILEWSEIPNGQELFESLLVFENYPIDEALKRGIRALKIEDVKVVEQTHYPLMVRIVQLEAGLSCTIVYDSARLLPTTIEHLLGHWHRLLEGMVETPDTTLADLPLLTNAERHQLLVEWNATSSSYPTEMCLHQLFEVQVEQTPEAIALIFEEQHLTYQDLNERANRLACYLRELGIGPEVMVGICLERSVEMIVGLLGTLKAGGA
jgi:non-ribosomal peptide synthetase component F